MRYLKAEKFLYLDDYSKLVPYTVKMSEEDEPHDASVAEMLLIVVRTFRPSDKFPLAESEAIDNLNIARRILAKPAPESGYYEFESQGQNSPWDILKRVALFTFPQTTVYHLKPTIEKYLDAATDKKPEPPPASANGHSDAPVPEKEAVNAP